MYLTIALRKEVENTEQAQILVDVVKTKLIDHPEITISASCSEQIEPTEL